MQATSTTPGASGRAEPAGGEFIDFERYQSLLISRHAIERADDAARGLRGLRFQDTGQLYLIAEEQLARASRSYAS